MDLNKYQGIIFDMDGTLVDSMPRHAKAWQRTCEHYSIPFDKAYMWNLGGVPTKQIAVLLNEKFNLSHDPEAVTFTKRSFWREDTSTPALIQVTNEIYQFYLNKMPIAVGTGSDRKHAEELLAEHGILSNLAALVTSSDVKNGKPHPETFLTAASKMSIPAHKCIVFEDTQIGFQAAQNAGMDCILVQNGKLVSM
ncbi:beta-phosphoglucomutase family hydrolase [Shewanella sp. 1_MG-2023]|uniref:beta-phosphoglucomutase family hydrolase n=1 Tax=unclassified Shewanella TaxID=196818 RepID=UPI0026E374C1|nr:MULTISPECIES: beta-phosphoglucomutase family hydrolase [unclassified Shewanella]MDO6612309.1 beta-phosphoglucomutase family hydrolase [Shewanella sp. 7_MG-2023]MDO6772163.1 beta-phosphoglucomutase family hydrolase [Shewanella sp. 2_MG-2023]MDO6794069.1 beta-phosphoglucomutase family hydrolase [Shewanella sp. 1_MG-2023]